MNFNIKIVSKFNIKLNFFHYFLENLKIIMEDYVPENLPFPPPPLLACTGSAALPRVDNTFLTDEEEAEISDENGFYRKHPHFHRTTFYFFSPSGFTWNGFRVDLTHKDTNTKFGPDGKTWADSYKEFVTEEHIKVCQEYPHPDDSFQAKRRLENYLNALEVADKIQEETFVGSPALEELNIMIEG
jgi:hypothetical protein